jgi:hypothetical protein
LRDTGAISVPECAYLWPVAAHGGLAKTLEGVRTAQGLAGEPVEELAAGLLAEFFGHGSDTVSRRNAINAVTQRLGLGGPGRLMASRILAEGWQLLENHGLICRDPDQSQGDWWFLTRAGDRILQASDQEVALTAALTPPHT